MHDDNPQASNILPDLPPTYPLPQYSLPGLDLKHQLEDLLELRRFLESRGIQTHNTRIARYIEYLDHSIHGKLIPPSGIFKNIKDSRFRSDLDWFLYVLRETHELNWIWKGLKINVPTGIDKKMQKIVSGTDFAAIDSNTEARNTQFELRIASYFCQSGCTVDLSTDTDVIATCKQFTFYVECKRIAAGGNLERNLVQAKRQLLRHIPAMTDKSGIYGIIAADVTRVAFIQNGLTMGITADNTRDIIQNKLMGISDSIDSSALFDGFQRLIQCWLQIHIPAYIMHPPAAISRFSSVFLINTSLDRKACKASVALHNLREYACRDDPRTKPPVKLTPRTETRIPDGTTFHFNESLFKFIIEGSGDLSSISGDEVIAGATMNGVTHDFTTFDFLMLTPGMLADALRTYKKDPVLARLEIIIQMYAQRYPYVEGSDEKP